MEIPTIYIGMKFTSPFIKGIITVIDFTDIKLYVNIYRGNDNSHDEDWDMLNTLWGFERGDYMLLP